MICNEQILILCFPILMREWFNSLQLPFLQFYKLLQLCGLYQSTRNDRVKQRGTHLIAWMLLYLHHFAIRSMGSGHQGDARTAGRTSNSLNCENDGAKNTTMLQLSTSNIMSWMTSLTVLWRIACVHCFDRSSALVRLSAKAEKNAITSKKQRVHK